MFKNTLEWNHRCQNVAKLLQVFIQPVCCFSFLVNKINYNLIRSASYCLWNLCFSDYALFERAVVALKVRAKFPKGRVNKRRSKYRLHIHINF